MALPSHREKGLAKVHTLTRKPPLWNGPLFSLCFFALLLSFSPPAISQETTPTPGLQSPSAPKPQNSPEFVGDPSTLFARAKHLADNDRATDAEILIRQFLVQHGNSADAHFMLGYILFREIQENAKSATHGRAEKYPLAAQGSSERSFRDAKARESLAEYTEGAKYHPPSAFDLKIVGLNYVLLGDLAAADKWLTQSLEWNPADVEAWYDLGRTKYNENHFEAAIHAFEQALKLEPNNVKAEDNLGLSYAGLGRTDDAIAAYQRAIEWQAHSKDKNPGPFINLGSLLLDLNRPEEAIPHLRKAIDLAPQEFKPHELLGKSYARLNQFPEAQAELEKAVALAPQYPSLHCMLGTYYRKQGLMDKAKAELDRCAELTGTHSSPDAQRP
jgi:Flp pilus assembly protein TadD